MQHCKGDNVSVFTVHFPKQTKDLPTSASNEMHTDRTESRPCYAMMGQDFFQFGGSGTVLPVLGNKLPADLIKCILKCHIQMCRSCKANYVIGFCAHLSVRCQSASSIHRGPDEAEHTEVSVQHPAGLREEAISGSVCVCGGVRLTVQAGTVSEKLPHAYSFHIAPLTALQRCMLVLCVLLSVQYTIVHYSNYWLQD